MSITVVLTNWKRTRNIRKIIKNLARQSVKPQIFVWNNSTPLFSRHVDWTIRSSVNTACWTRWLMGSMADTEYLCIMDDDLIPTDFHLLKDAMKFMENCPERMLVGSTGLNVSDPSIAYKHCPRFYSAPGENVQVDMILGRLVFLKTKALRHVHLYTGRSHRKSISDDIIISAALAQGQAQYHCVPSVFHGRLAELPAPHALSSSPTHYDLRDETRREVFLAGAPA